jgi:hypothetical protein
MAADWYHELLQTPPASPEFRTDRPDVAAYEVAQWMYCGRAWWLRNQGGPSAEASTAMEDGERRHAMAGHAVRIAKASGMLERMAVWAVVGAGVLAMMIVGLLLMGGR